MSKKKNKKIKVLAWCDSPAVATGFATVSRGIFNYLASTGKYDIDIIGINDRGGHKDPKQFPYRIYPARVVVQTDSDFYGRPRLIASLLGKDPDLTPPWDLVFTLNDPFILEQAVPVFKKSTLGVLKEINETVVKKLPPEWTYKTISYFPVDSELKVNWVEDSISLADYPVMYTEYGKGEIFDPTGFKDRLRVIPHGYNEKDFYQVDEKERQEFRESYFDGKVGKNTFLVVSVARNQLRKDLPRTMKIFKEFQRRRPESFLYLHSQEQDAWGSLREYGKTIGLEYGEDWGVPAGFSANKGFPIDAVNMIYNSADVIISTSLGEGLGFYNLEGFATGRPVLAPDNTAHPELFGYEPGADISDMDWIAENLRGIPMLSGSNSSEWATYGPQDYERIRPLVNVDDGIKKLLWIYNNRDKAKAIGQRAKEWVKDYTWDKVGAMWDNLFEEAYADLQEERKKINYEPKKDAKAKKV